MNIGIYLPISINYEKGRNTTFTTMDSWLEVKGTNQSPLRQSLQLEFKI